MPNKIYPKVWCWFDRCCEFETSTHNARYCTTHKCKRKVENQHKRLTLPVDLNEEVWVAQESKKINTLISAQAKNQWLLDNSSFAFFDIEATDLSANVGMLMCASIRASIRDHADDTISFVSQEKGGYLDDKQSCIDIRNYLEKFDYVVTYYGTGYDVPFLNTRLLIHGDRPLDKIRHVDMYYHARRVLKLTSNRLAVVTETLFGQNDKTRILWPVWNKALQGDLESMGYIVEHCEIDVKVLQDVFNTLRWAVNLSATRWRKAGASY